MGCRTTGCKRWKNIYLMLNELYIFNVKWADIAHLTLNKIVMKTKALEEL